MSDPQEPLKLLAIPARGSDVDTWDTPVNADFTAIGGMLGGFTTVSLTNAPVTLTAPSGTPTAGPGPTQIQNSLIIFSGTLSGNCVVTFPLPGQYNILNNCVVGAFYVQLSGGSGNKIGVPPGQAVSVFSNGTSMQFVSLPPVGSYWDYAGSTVPAWIAACTVAPWLVCDGSTPLIATYPQLAAILGTAFGGNGINTFGLPDCRNRFGLPVDTGGNGRVTTAGSGIDGTTVGAVGGSQFMQQHLHANTASGIVNRTGILVTNGVLDVPASGAAKLDPTVAIDNPAVTVTMTNANAGSGASQNMPPAIVFGTRFIKT